MVKKYNFRCVISCCVIGILLINLVGTYTCVYAQENRDSEITYNKINANTLEVSYEDKIETIKVENLDETISQVSVIGDQGERTIYTVDKENRTIRISGNDTVFSLDEFLEEDDSLQGQLRANGSTVTKKISFAKIKKALTGTATVATIAGIVISVLTGLGYALPGMLAVLTEKVGQISTVVALVTKGSSSHGLAVKMKSYMRSTTKNGKVYKYKAWKVTNVSKY